MSFGSTLQGNSGPAHKHVVQQQKLSRHVHPATAMFSRDAAYTTDLWTGTDRPMNNVHDTTVDKTMSMYMLSSARVGKLS